MYAVHIPVHAAAEQQRKKNNEEEEEMTNYSQSDLDNDWEFKIVRSTLGAFRKPHVLQTLIEEEALAGWEMVEKFDDNRVRFKRPRSAMMSDETLPEYIDPYRTQYGGMGSQTAVRVGIFIVVLLLVMGMAVFLFVAAN